VTIGDSTPNATIYYTTNGSTPTTSSPLNCSSSCGPITVSSTETLEAIATASGYSTSAVATAAYTITAPPPPAATPTFSPPAGAYAFAQTVTISDATSGATIYYTTNGTTPTTSSSVYSGPIATSSGEPIVAIATASGYSNSAVATAAYTVTGRGDWTWIAGSSSDLNGQGQPGVYGTLGTPAPGNVPGGRDEAVSWTDSSGNLWLFGGIGYDAGGTLGWPNDLWEFNPYLGTGGEWAWMGGSNQLIGGSYSGLRGYYGTLGTPSTGNIPGGRDDAVSWTDKSGNLWLFGGYGYDSIDNEGYLNDLWEFTPSTGAWTWMGGSSTVPAAYSGQPGVYGTLGAFAATNVPGGRVSAQSWTDSNGHFWLFGGSGYNSAAKESFTANDLWEFNPSLGAHGEWAWMGGSSTSTLSCGGVVGDMTCYQSGVYGTLGTPAQGNVPGSRWGASTWIDSSNHLWLFGGEGYAPGEGWLNDLWEFNPSLGPNGEWAWMGGSSTINQSGTYSTLPGTPGAAYIPGGRYGASSWTDSSGNFWLFGGSGYYGASNLGNLNDLWEFNSSLGQYGQWAWMGGSSTGNQSGVYGTLGMPASGNIPGARDGAVSWTDSSGNFWLFGGGGYDANGNDGELNDLWVYPPSAASLPAAATPTFSLATGSYVGAQTVYIYDTTTGATIYYTTDTSTPTTSSPLNCSSPCGPITVSSTETINAIATASGYSTSAEASAVYTITVMPQVPTPTFSPTAGALSPGETVAINDTLSQAAILYTTDGTTPTFTGNGLSPIPGPNTTRYNGPITVTPPETIEAIATAFNFSPSAVAIASYTITLAPAQVMDSETITVTDTETFPDVVDAETIKVTDIDAVKAYNAFAITPSVASFNASSGTGYVTHAYGPVTFTATGGDGTTLTLSESGALPPGLTFVNGVLSGTPTTYSAASFPFSITASDADGDSLTVPGYMLTIQPASAYPAMVTDQETITVTDTETFPDVADAESITVTDIDTVTAFNAIAISPTSAAFNAGSSATGIINQPYAPPAFTATGGDGTTLTLTETGALPTGVTFVNGVFSGTPAATSVGSYPFSITATDADGHSATQTGYTLTITTVAQPTVTSVSPASGPATGGTTVTITGTNFTSASTVRFGATTATNVSCPGTTRCTATSPAGAAGTVDITVTTPGGISATSAADQFTYVATPVVTYAAQTPITYGAALTNNLDATTAYGTTSLTSGGNTSYTAALGTGPSVPVTISTVLAAGTYTLAATWTPNTANASLYTVATGYTTLVVSKAPLSVTGNNISITYGQAVPPYSATIAGFVNGDTDAVISGTPSLTTSPATPSAAGTYTIAAALGSLTASNYTFTFTNGTLTINKATPPITWATPAPIIYPTALSATQLDATSTVLGTFAYTPAAGTVPSAGTSTLSVTLTPNDTTDYTTATATVQLTVNKATPPITWATPAAITYGTALSGTQLNASSTVAGTFVYTPVAGAVLSAGTQTLSVLFTPNSTITDDYTTATATVQLTVNKATPTVPAWPTTSAINLGQTLASSTLSGGTASVSGSFAWTTPSTSPGAGTPSESVTFTPADTADYTTVTGSVNVTVNNPTPVISSLSPPVASAGGAAFTLTVTGSGFVANSTVIWGGATALITTYGSGTQLTAQVPADIAPAGIYNITVETPAPGGGTSNASQFEVDSAGSGTITFTNPTVTVTPGSPANYSVTLPSGSTFVSVTCLDLPTGAGPCSYSSGSVTIPTSATTPVGNDQIVVVFTLTEPGSGTGFILLPFLLLPLVFLRRKLAARGVWVTTCLVLVLLAGVAATFAGCGGGGGSTHQATSSGVVTLIVQ
jgi:hypothetical protein